MDGIYRVLHWFHTYPHDLPESSLCHTLSLRSETKITKCFQTRSKKPNSAPLLQRVTISQASARAKPVSPALSKIVYMTKLGTKCSVQIRIQLLLKAEVLLVHQWQKGFVSESLKLLRVGHASPQAKGWCRLAKYRAIFICFFYLRGTCPSGNHLMFSRVSLVFGTYPSSQID